MTARNHPGMINPAPQHSREITTHVRTTHMGDGQVLATYHITWRGVDPHATPVYARLKLVGREWRASIMLQALASDEIRSLRALCDTLMDMDIGANEEVLQVHAVTAQWGTWSSLPWEQQPLGLRKSKPRRKRLWRTDPHTGARYKLYADTGARYAHEPSIFKKTKPPRVRGSYTTNPKEITR